MDEWIALFWAVLLLICSIGSLVLAKLYEQDKQRRADAEQFWQQLQANMHNGGLRGHLFTDEDHLQEPPLLPEDYRDWNSKR